MAQRNAWLTRIIILVLVLGMVVFGVILQGNKGSNWGYVIGVGSGLAVLVMYGGFDSNRVRKVMRIAHASEGASAVMYEQFSKQLAAVGKISGVVVRGQFRRASHNVVTISPERLTIWPGLNPQIPRVEIPVTQIRGASIVKAPQGTYKLNCVRLEVADDLSTAVLDLCLIDSRFLIPLISSARRRIELASAINRSL